MFYINVTYDCKPGMREAFYKAIQNAAIDTTTRAENGCARYEFFNAIESPDRLFLAEAWENRDVHAAHKAADHVRKLQELKAEYVASSSVVRTED